LVVLRSIIWVLFNLNLLLPFVDHQSCQLSLVQFSLRSLKNTDNSSSKVNSKTQNNNKFAKWQNRKIMSIKSIAAKLFAQKNL
jgi:hypothetical protein